MALPERPDPEADKRRARQYAGRKAKAYRKAQQELADALRFARDAGWSLRDLEAETGIPFRTIERWSRPPAEDGEDEGDSTSEG